MNVGPKMEIERQFQRNIDEWRELLGVLDSLNGPLAEACHLIGDTLVNGKKLLICGNGGSAADAAHFCSELIGRYLSDRRPYPAICLNVNGADLTCIANDYGSEEIFSRQVEGFGSKGDVVVVFSTSGNSINILRALEKADEIGASKIAFLGRDGGAALGRSNIELIIPSNSTARIQEAHTLLLHSICDYLETEL